MIIWLILLIIAVYFILLPLIIRKAYKFLKKHEDILEEYYRRREGW